MPEFAALTGVAWTQCSALSPLGPHKKITGYGTKENTQAAIAYLADVLVHQSVDHITPTRACDFNCTRLRAIEARRSL